MKLEPGYYIVVYVEPHLIYVGRSDRGRIEGHDVETCYPFNVPMEQVHSIKPVSHEVICNMLRDKKRLYNPILLKKRS